MKKIISLLIATIMMFSFAAISYAEGGDVITTISNPQLTVGSESKTVDMTFTFKTPDPTSLTGFASKIYYNKSALKLNTYTFSGDITWDTGKTDTSFADYDYLNFMDTSYAGCSYSDEYILTLNFTVNDVSKAGDYPVAIKEITATDNSFMGWMDYYNVLEPEAGSISVKETTPPEPTTTTSYFGANVKTSEKPSLAQILVYTFTTNDEGAARNTATREIDLGSANFETPTTINTAARVSGIPDGVTVDCSVAWK